jgi:hypothetical protein
MHWLLPIVLVIYGQLEWGMIVALVFIIQEHFNRYR